MYYNNDDNMETLSRGTTTKNNINKVKVNILRNNDNMMDEMAMHMSHMENGHNNA